MTIDTFGLTKGPAIYVGMFERVSLPCRIVRFWRDGVDVRWPDGTKERVHPEGLRQ